MPTLPIPKRVAVGLDSVDSAAGKKRKALVFWEGSPGVWVAPLPLPSGVSMATAFVAALCSEGGKNEIRSESG